MPGARAGLLGALLLLAAAAAAAALPGAAGAGRQGRKLAQTTCGAIPNCQPRSCYRVAAGWRCSACSLPYLLASNGRVCACPVGMYAATAGCMDCPLNSYCPFLTRAPVACPGVLVTVNKGAKRIAQCVNPPGYRYVPGAVQPIAKPCLVDEFSEGLAKQLNCTPCSKGTATNPANVRGTHTSESVCIAPPGTMLSSDRVAVPCSVGTFKEGYTDSGVGCTPCSAAPGRANFTTPGPGSNSSDDCRYLKAGYAAVLKGQVLLGNATSLSGLTAKLCPHDHFCAGGDPTDGGYARPCSGGRMTQDAGAVTEDACVAPPGYMYNGSWVDECLSGYYKPGWGAASSCTPCGNNAATSEAENDPEVGWKSDRLVRVPVRDPDNGLPMRWLSTRGNSTACYLRLGMGALVSATTGGLDAVACGSGFYGIASAKLYGQTRRECSACPTRQATGCDGVDDGAAAAACAAAVAPYSVQYGAVTAYFAAAACMHTPGWGWVKTAWPATGANAWAFSSTDSAPCLDGFYSPGGHNSTCTACPRDLMTGIEGATQQGQCVAPPGFRFVSSSSPALECASGYFKEGYSNATSCTPCGALPGLWKSAAVVNLTKPNPVTGVPLVVRVRGSSASCYLLPGVGTTGSTPGALGTEACSSNSYGPAAVQWGNAASPCTPCPSYQVTNCTTVADVAAKASCEAELAGALYSASGGFTSEAACRFIAGHGYVEASPAPCAVATYSAGGHRGTCTACTGGLTTAATGSTSANDCVAGPGYFYSSGTALVCPDGTYKSTYDRSTSCTACSVDTHSSLPRTSESDCYT